MRSSAARRLAAALAQRWGAAEPAAAGAAGGRGAPACRALYHRHNPWNMKVEREDGEELPGVQNLELSMDEMDEHKKKAEKGLESAKQAALKMLSSRAHSRKELKTKLLERGHELHDVRDALDRLEAVGLQSDAEFAETFARSKWRQSKWGARRIGMELHHRGVSVELAAAALRSVFGEDGLDLAQHLEQLDDEQGERLPLAHAGEPPEGLEGESVKAAGVPRRSLLAAGGAAAAAADAGPAAAHTRELLQAPTCQQSLTTARTQLNTCQKSVTDLNTKLKAAQAATQTANKSVAAKNVEITNLKKQLAAKPSTAAARPAVGVRSTTADACGDLQTQLDAKTSELQAALQRLANVNQELTVTRGLLANTQKSLDSANARLLTALDAEGAPCRRLLQLWLGRGCLLPWAGSLALAGSNSWGASWAAAVAQLEDTAAEMDGWKLTAAESAKRERMLQEGLDECNTHRFDDTADLAACGNKLVDAQRAEADAKNELGECQADLKSLQSQCDECTKTLATGR
ncbi:hypothetical protein COHA_000711 [Chlorella ohadii]|uniref:Regulatory protein RecX n=1 Tax=Chlorella ohadii TaxID=2649997 RepID=A0AAD5E0M6_9CHLO|nr:hypothetical protein COHA_000711 [Chlorella ohadii]